MKTPRKAKVLKSFVTKKKKSCLKTSLKAKPKSSNKPRKIENYDCNFVDELKLRSRVRINKHFVKRNNNKINKELMAWLLTFKQAREHLYNQTLPSITHILTHILCPSHLQHATKLQCRFLNCQKACLDKEIFFFQDCCLSNPNYAIICDFLIKFTEILDLPIVPLKDLHLMIGK